jgi:hypothetical protein
LCTCICVPHFFENCKNYCKNQSVLKQAVRAIQVTYRKQQKLFEPFTAYVDLVSKPKLRLLLYALTSELIKKESLSMSAKQYFPSCSGESR